jgi:capsid protein
MAEGKIKQIWNVIVGEKPKAIEQPKTEAFFGRYSNSIGVSFNGEKNLGEIGHPKDYTLDYDTLRVRSWQAYLESEVFQTIINKFKLWVIGSGLKMKSDPIEQVLKSEAITINTEAFNEVAETRFAVWAKTKMSDYCNMVSLNKIAQSAFLNAKIGGDVLVVLRVVKGVVKVQLIDGCHVQSPNYGTEAMPEILSNGNRIINGIESKPNGEVVAFYIRNEDYSFQRIPAKSPSTGLTMAYLVYGASYRIDNNRGIPIMSTVLESLKKLERYSGATLGSAEEAAKIVFQVVHDRNSTGENPLQRQLARARDADATDMLPVSEEGRQLADRVAATTNKQAFNMPIGSEIKQLAPNQRELYFKDFYETYFNIMCASVGIPPNVAMSLYNDSFSASRAALKDWEHTLFVNRDDFTEQFYQPIYSLWLHLEIFLNKVQAPGYLAAFNEGNEMVLNAYRNARFTGAIPGHIDPLKEVKAVREMLGGTGKDIPLITVEQGVEILRGENSDEVMKQYSEELKYSKELGIEQPNEVAPTTDGED